jgi:hypothetical protein
MVHEGMVGQYRGEFVERFHGALRDGLAGTLVRESIVGHNHSCPVALLEELHDYSRDGLAKISVVGDPFRLDDLVVLAGKRKFARSVLVFAWWTQAVKLQNLWVVNFSSAANDRLAVLTSSPVADG